MDRIGSVFALISLENQIERFSTIVNGALFAGLMFLVVSSTQSFLLLFHIGVALIDASLLGYGFTIQIIRVFWRGAVIAFAGGRICRRHSWVLLWQWKTVYWHFWTKFYVCGFLAGIAFVCLVGLFACSCLASYRNPYVYGRTPPFHNSMTSRPKSFYHIGRDVLLIVPSCLPFYWTTT